MSSIGIIVKADRDIEELSQDWYPEVLGDRAIIKRMVEDKAGITFNGDKVDLLPVGINLSLEVGDDEPPRSVTASGVFGDKEIDFLKKLCAELEARFYDSEEGSFIF